MMYFFLLLFLSVFPATASSVPEVTPPLVAKQKHNSDAAVVIGNENYRRLPQVVYAQNDAQAVSQFLKTTRRVPSWKTSVLKNATKKDIEQALQKRSRYLSKKGTLWVYFAGHGYTDKQGNRYLLPIDADPNEPLKDSIELNEMMQKISKRGNRVVLIVDSSFGNTGRDGLPVLDVEKVHMPYEVAYTNPKQVFWLADSMNRGNPSFSAAQHGLFTYLVLGAMQGWADGELDNQPDGSITLGEAQAFVAHKILQLGTPVTPSVFLSKEPQNWLIHQAPKLKEAPNDAVFEQLSIAIRLRYFANSAELLRARAVTKWNSVLYDVQRGGQQGEDSLRNFLEEYERASVSIEWMAYVPQVAEARRLLRDYANAGNIIQFDPEACSTPQDLEAEAMLGELTVEQIACIEARLRLERLQTEKSKLSLLLINNAFNQKNWDEWEIRTRHHLSGIDRSQPDMTFSFAIYLRKKGEEYYEESLGWTEYTLDTRTQWPEGQQFVAKSNKLYQFRAELAMSLWMMAEARYTNDRTAELDQLSQEARGQASDLAREWLDYTRGASLDSKLAFNMCMSASQDPEFCKE